MPVNYVLLEKITVGAANASSVTFSSIPQTGYTDLVVKASVRDSYPASWRDLGISFNGLTTNRTGKLLYGNPTTIGSYSVTTGNLAFSNSNTSTGNTFSSIEFYIPNYASANYKSFSVDSVTENNSSDAVANISAGLWSSTAAITSITLTPLGGSLVQYSTFYLYGVAKLGTSPATSPYATGGDVIVTDGTYWIHTFYASGTFTPTKPLTCDYIVVAGGGGGGAPELYSYNGGGGGGGAGGLRSTIDATGGGGSLESKLSLAVQAYTVTIGAGGTYGTWTGGSSAGRGGSGSNSVLGSITATGGGGAGAGNNITAYKGGLTGGSGGGGGAASGAGASGTSNQGYAGGNASPQAAGGGGGGAGSAGANAVGTSAGNRGTGVASSITGSSVTRAYGGYGGTPTGASGADATANTGSGGDGAGGNGAVAGAGGSGIVIVRYPI